MLSKRSYPFRILNVFAESTFGGNPLCVFEHAEGMSDAEMQALALQFNLSETCFILPSDKATAKMRIFTPDAEMGFAGHPSIGTAHVVKELRQSGSILNLECKAGLVPLQLDDEIWTFTAPQTPKITPCDVAREEIARMLGLQDHDLLGDPVWVNTGSDQILVPLVNEAAVRRAQLNGALLGRWPKSSIGRQTAYVFAFDSNDTDDTDHQNNISVTARYFFARRGGGVGEDPATGSACANLGGWWLHSLRKIPMTFTVSQGAQMLRPSKLYLHIMNDESIQVGGKVQEIGRGVIQI